MLGVLIKLGIDRDNFISSLLKNDHDIIFKYRRMERIEDIRFNMIYFDLLRVKLGRNLRSFSV